MFRRKLASSLRKVVGLIDPSLGGDRNEHGSPVPVDSLMHRVEEMTKTGFWRLDCRTGHVFWSPQVFAIHEMAVSDHVDLDKALSYYPDSSARQIEEAVAEASESGTPYDLELDFVSDCGTRKRVRALGQAEKKAGEVVALIGVFQDISERHNLEQQLRQVATTDELTDLPNRRHLRMYFEDRKLAHRGSKPKRFACFLIDLDHFKSLNDSLGHDAGDRALQISAERLRHPSLRGSFAARLGGDEFVMFIEDDDLLDQIDKTSSLVLTLLNQPFHWERRRCAMSATIGIGWFEDTGQPLSEVLRCADAALYSAKKRGRGTALISTTEDLLMSDGPASEQFVDRRNAAA